MPLLLGQAGEDVTLMVLDELEGDGQVVVLEDGLVIVDERQLGARVDQILVGHPRVVHVVDGAGQDRRQHLATRCDCLINV